MAFLVHAPTVRFRWVIRCQPARAHTHWPALGPDLESHSPGRAVHPRQSGCLNVLLSRSVCLPALSDIRLPRTMLWLRPSQTSNTVAWCLPRSAAVWRNPQWLWSKFGNPYSAEKQHYNKLRKKSFQARVWSIGLSGQKAFDRRFFQQPHTPWYCHGILA